MRIAIDVALTSQRMTAHLRDGTMLFDDVAVMALEPADDGRLLISGIGKTFRSVSGALVLPVVSRLDFRPQLAAGVASFIAMKSWIDLRPKWKGMQAALDRVEVSIAIEGYESLAPEQRREFAKALPYHRQITWWVAGEKVKY